MIELKNVRKIYPGTTLPAVDEVSLFIEKGKVCIFVGPSGCGKTTILKMLNRLIEPTTGRIFINGDNIMDVDPDQLRRGIGYVIQQIGLLPHRTIEQNVEIVPRLLKWPEDRIKKRVVELLEIVGLDPKETAWKYPYQLSGGQMQRAGVARALASDPPIMLMDEPFGAVDPIIREHLQDEFLKLQQEVKKTICFVTHDINEALKMGDYLVVLESGKIVQKGSPLEVLSSPANDFVRRLLGDDRGVKLLDLTRIESLMIGEKSLPHNSEKCRCFIDVVKPVKMALEIMMKNNTDIVGVRRGEEVIGTLSWAEIKQHISKLSGDQ
ncbi:MAG TPA: ATP-binding cassette domain-containing protein [Firmicutes bacterium]|nr:ATP-binding cassette domain-containing protein [Bacillota bacterium]